MARLIHIRSRLDGLALDGVLDRKAQVSPASSRAAAAAMAAAHLEAVELLTNNESCLHHDINGLVSFIDALLCRSNLVFTLLKHVHNLSLNLRHARSEVVESLRFICL